MPTIPIVLGYYSEWQQAVPPAQINYGLFTHLTHAFARVDPVSGALKMPDTTQTRDLLHRAHAARVKVLLAVGGANSGPSLNTLTTSDHATMLLARRITAAVRDAGYDGVDLDWEFPEDAAQATRMNRLVKALRAALGDKLLTMAIPASDWNGKWFQTEALSPHLDFANVMTYDFAGEWSQRAGHNAGMSDTADAIRYWTERRKWPRAKFNLGIPLYGRGFRARRFGDPTTGVYEHSSVAARDLAPLRRAGWKDGVSDATTDPFLISPSGEEILGYDNARATHAKGVLAQHEKLAGVFFWEVSQDEPGQPLVRAARAGLRGL